MKIIYNENFKYAYGAFWFRIFYHNLQKASKFANEAEAKNSNLEYKYSILDQLNDNYKYKDNKFEFLLEYPDYGNSYYYRWKQYSNPLFEEEKGQATASEFESIHYAEPSLTNFAGLVKTVTTSSNPLSLLNGCPIKTGESNWNYGIGLYNGAYFFSNNNKLYNYPLYLPTGSNVVQLWVRVHNQQILTCHIKKHLNIAYLIIFII